MRKNNSDVNGAPCLLYSITLAIWPRTCWRPPISTGNVNVHIPPCCNQESRCVMNEISFIQRDHLDNEIYQEKIKKITPKCTTGSLDL